MKFTIKKLSFVKNLDNEFLANPFPITSLNFRDNRRGLMHIIRHEGTHQGQLTVSIKLIKAYIKG